MKTVLLGYGDILRRVYHLLNNRNRQLITVSRSTDHHPDPDNAVALDLSAHPDLSDLFSKADTVVYTPTPTGRDAAGYQQGYLDTVEHLVKFLDPSTRLILVSSTRVYRGYANRVVNDEDTPLPTDPQGTILAQMERVALKRDNTVILRPSGIYGRGYARWEKLAQGQTPSTRVGNRIHADDLAQIICFITELTKPERSYLCSDFEPASEAEIWDFLRGVEGKRQQSVSGLRYQPTRLISSGFKFRYPTYREGLVGIKQ